MQAGRAVEPTAQDEAHYFRIREGQRGSLGEVSMVGAGLADRGVVNQAIESLRAEKRSSSLYDATVAVSKNHDSGG